MNFFLILFFISLTAIIFMIGRKFSLFKKNDTEGLNIPTENIMSDLFDVDKFKFFLVKKIKEIIHILTWIILKIYLISANFISKKRTEIILKIKHKFNKYRKKGGEKEVSKYLKIISEYRHKIKKIKHKIKQEEGIE